MLSLYGLFRNRPPCHRLCCLACVFVPKTRRYFDELFKHVERCYAQRTHNAMISTSWEVLQDSLKVLIWLADRCLWDAATQRPWRSSSIVLVDGTYQSSGICRAPPGHIHIILSAANRRVPIITPTMASKTESAGNRSLLTASNRRQTIMAYWRGMIITTRNRGALSQAINRAMRNQLEYAINRKQLIFYSAD